MSQPFAEELQEDDDEECSAHDSGLDPVLGLGAGRAGPLELDVSDDEAAWCQDVSAEQSRRGRKARKPLTKCTCKVDPGGTLTTSLGI